MDSFGKFIEKLDKLRTIFYDNSDPKVFIQMVQYASQYPKYISEFDDFDNMLDEVTDMSNNMSNANAKIINQYIQQRKIYYYQVGVEQSIVDMERMSNNSSKKRIALSTMQSLLDNPIQYSVQLPKKVHTVLLRMAREVIAGNYPKTAKNVALKFIEKEYKIIRASNTIKSAYFQNPKRINQALGRLNTNTISAARTALRAKGKLTVNQRQRVQNAVLAKKTQVLQKARASVRFTGSYVKSFLSDMSTRKELSYYVRAFTRLYSKGPAMSTRNYTANDVTTEIMVCHMKRGDKGYLKRAYRQLELLAGLYHRKTPEQRKKFWTNAENALGGRPCLENALDELSELLTGRTFMWKGKTINALRAPNNKRYISNLVLPAITSYVNQMNNKNRFSLIKKSIPDRKKYFWDKFKNLQVHTLNKNGIPSYNIVHRFNVNGKHFFANETTNEILSYIPNQEIPTIQRLYRKKLAARKNWEPFTARNGNFTYPAMRRKDIG